MFAVILIASLLPTENLPKGNDKLHHFLSYAVLAWWCTLAFQISDIKKLFLLAVYLITFGGIIEILQGLSGYRYAEWLDFLANSLGVVIGVLFAFYVTKKILFFVETKLCKH